MCTVFAYENNQASLKTCQNALKPARKRGPDDERLLQLPQGWLGFQRLAIMDLEPSGMQPFLYHDNALVCNGEIYGFRPIKQALEEKGVEFHSESDCEILLPLYEEKGVEMFKDLDAEYACILYDGKSGQFIAARDPIGIRPLYYGYDAQGHIAFASEPKILKSLVEKILPFPPGHYYKEGKFVCYRDLAREGREMVSDMDEILSQINQRLKEGVYKRLDSDAPLGFLLSGGLDSSLVCAIAADRLSRPIETFAIGMEGDAIDLKYARTVADYIGSHHHEYTMSKEEILDALETVIEDLATFDVTTIRASLGMYLLCKKIHEETRIRVLLTGEISDELFGYKYTDFAPDKEAFQKESEKRIEELHMYDVLRADRCIADNSIEARVPFGDLGFASYVLSIDPALKMNTYNKGKYLLRKAFEKDRLLPEEILFREKAAFSDAVGHSLADELKAYAESLYTDQEFEEKAGKYAHARPYSKESLLYRELFEKYYPGQAEMIVDFWMPNREWPGCDVNDPSARYLSNYGQSGQ